MNPAQLPLILLDGLFAVCKLQPTDPVPSWAAGGSFVCITRTDDELSIVCPQECVPAGVKCESNWRCLRVAGALPFTAIGVLSALVAPLSAAGISVFAVSTFDTDYLLVKDCDLETTLQVYSRAGHKILSCDAKGTDGLPSNAPKGP